MPYDLSKDARLRQEWFCPVCKKVTYVSRKAARRKARLYPEGQLSQYRCPGNADWWHNGHIPGVVRRGELTKSEWKINKQSRGER